MHLTQFCLLLTFGFLSIAFNAYGNTDSLVIFKTQFYEKTNQRKYQEAYDISTKLYNGYWKHPDTMLLWANHRYDLALKMNAPYFEAKSLCEISFTTFQLGQYEASIAPALKADSILQLHPSDKLKFEILYRLAEGYEYTGKPEMSMQKYSACYTLAEKLGHKKRLIYLDTKLGNIYKFNNDFDKALDYFNSALNRINRKENLSWYLTTAGNVFNLKVLNPELFDKEELQQACDSITAHYKTIKTDKSLERLESFYFNLYVGAISVTNNRKELKKIVLPSFEELRKKYSNREHLILFLTGYFDLAMMRQDFKLATEYTNGLYGLNEEGDQEHDIGFRLNALKQDKTLKTAQKDFKALVAILNEIHELELKIQAEDRMNSISNLEGVLEAKKKENEIQLLNKDKEILVAQSQQRFLLLLGVAAIAIFGLGFLWNARRKNKIIRLQNQQLEQINNTKDRLFAIIGHDLRKPAIAFRGISKKVRYLIQKKDFDTLEKLGNQIEQNALALNKLTDNLLNWALIQRNVMPYKPKEVNVSDIVKDIAIIFSGKAQEKQLQLRNNIPDNLVAYADPFALGTILTNLVDNAIKYTSEGGKIILHAQVEDQNIKIRVSDTGIGMDKDQLNDIFLLQKNKSEKGTQGEKGTGLGLHLVKELVELNKGVIHVASELGKGTSFDISLPSTS